MRTKQFLARGMVEVYYTIYMYINIFFVFSFLLLRDLDKADLWKIGYDGICPVLGYPSQLDPTKNLHNVASDPSKGVGAKELAGMELSESLSMLPMSSVLALVFACPKSQYFAVGQIGNDQVES